MNSSIIRFVLGYVLKVEAVLMLLLIVINVPNVIAIAATSR